MEDFGSVSTVLGLVGEKIDDALYIEVMAKKKADILNNPLQSSSLGSLKAL